MKNYRLKKEAVPFFDKAFSTEIAPIEAWKTWNISLKALEQVDPVYITYGINENGSTTNLCDSDSKEINIHFTLHFRSIGIGDFKHFTDKENVRALMDRIQSEINDFRYEYLDKQQNSKNL